MLNSLLSGCEGLIDWISGGGKRPATRVSRSAMPNGFFLDDLIWFGDGAQNKTPVSRGFMLEPGETSSYSARQLNSIHERLAMLLRMLGREYTLQVQWSIDSDYRRELEAFHRETLAIRRQDPVYGKFGLLIRAERYERYIQAMEEGRLRRERLTLFFTKVIDSRPPDGVGNLTKWYDELSRRESDLIGEFGSSALHRLFPECSIRAMTDESHFLYYFRFLNPNSPSSSHDPLQSFDPALSLQQNCALSEGYSHGGRAASASFAFDSYHHAILALRQWPRVTFPGIIASLTNFHFRDYSITLNLYPKSIEKEIKKEEDIISRLIIDARSEGKASLAVDAQLKTDRVAELQAGKIAPFLALFVVRVWHQNPEELSKRVQLFKQAFAAMGGAVAIHATIPENAKRLFFQTWPGWTCGSYRAFDLDGEDSFLADMIPWSASFTGHLDGADAIYNGARGNLVGIKMRLGGSPQQAAVLGMTGGGKSLIMADLMTQTSHKFGFKVIVEEGLSHGVLTQTQGCEPIIVNLNGSLTINYLDTGELPLTTTHLNMAAGLCMLFCGEAHVEGEEAVLRHSLIVEQLQRLYTDTYEDWAVGHPEAAEELRWRAYAIYRYLNTKMKGAHNTFLDAFVRLRDWEMQSPDEAQEFIVTASDEDVANFSQGQATRSYTRDLVFAYFHPKDFPTHSALMEMFLVNNKRNVRESDRCDRIGRLLQAWSKEGDKGILFDGVSNVRVDGRVAHFELGQIPEHAQDIKAAANFLVACYARQKIISMPRAVAKLAVFEEAARTLNIPGGEKMLEEYYRQMRKFGCNIIAVVQQYDAIKKSAVRGAVMGNSKMFFITAQQSPEDAREIGEALELNRATVEAFSGYELPELMDPSRRYNAFTYVANDKRHRLVGTVKNVACRELVYAAQSDGEIFDSRKEKLSQYQDIVDGIINESMSLPEPAPELSTEHIF